MIPQSILAFFISASSLLFILVKGYFLSIEFTLYPYLVSLGFIPYINILDQHFPSLFFGFFSLPLLSSVSPAPLLILFLSVVFITNLLLYRYLVIVKNSNPLLWLGLFVVIMAYFSVNILWIETFINLLLVIILNLTKKKNSFASILIGLMLSQIILLRPTLLPSILFFVIFLNIYNYQLLIGTFLGFATSFCYLLLHHNLSEFINLTIVFNASSYAKSSAFLPNLKQIAILTFLILYSIVNYLKSSQFYLLVTVILSMFAIFPRFGLEHLQPFVLFVVLLASQKNNLFPIIPKTIILGFLLLTLFGLYRNRYGNYFYQPQLDKITLDIQKLPGKEVYLFGASDLLYPLSGKVPSGKLYIPSLPWYLNYPQFQKVLFASLEKSASPVIVDTLFEVDGKKLTDTAPKVYEYIKMNYNLQETKDNIEIYLKKP